MTAWYELLGRVEVRPSPEVQEIVERFNAASIESLSAAYDEAGARVEFEGGATLSFGTIAELEDTAVELGPHAVQGTLLHWECDGDRGELYVGPDDQEAAVVSQSNLEAATECLEQMTVADLERLSQLALQKRR